MSAALNLRIWDDGCPAPFHFGDSVKSQRKQLQAQVSYYFTGCVINSTCSSSSISAWSPVKPGRMDQNHSLSAMPIRKSVQLASSDAVKFWMKGCESCVTGSSGSTPSMTLSRAAISHTDFAKMPGESNVVDDGNIPLRERRPVETFSPYKAVNDAGQLIEPCVSVASENGANPAATAATGPAEDPQGCCKSYGERVSPPSCDHPGLRLLSLCRTIISGYARCKLNASARGLGILEAVEFLLKESDD